MEFASTSINIVLLHNDLVYKAKFPRKSCAVWKVLCASVPPLFCVLCCVVWNYNTERLNRAQRWLQTLCRRWNQLVRHEDVERQQSKRMPCPVTSKQNIVQKKIWRCLRPQWLERQRPELLYYKLWTRARVCDYVFVKLLESDFMRQVRAFLQTAFFGLHVAV